MKRIKHFIKKELDKNNKLVKHGIVIFSASVIANLINYLFHLYMGRALGPEGYGIFASLLSISAIIIFSAGTVQTAMAKFVSEFKGKNSYGKIKTILVKFSVKLSFYAGLFLALLSVFSRQITSFLNISSPYLIILIFSFCWLSAVLLSINGIINGLQKFGWLGLNNIFGSFAKLALGIILVYAGLGVAGAILALNISTILAIAVAILPVAFLFKIKGDGINHSEIYLYFIPVFISTALLMTLINIDVILVKHFFDDLNSGYYAAASMIGKAIWFASGTLPFVMFPKVSEQNAKSRDSSRIMKTTLFYVFLISFIGIIAYFVAPTFIAGIFYGSRYRISGLIGYFGLAMALFSMSNVLAMYNLATGKTRFIYIIGLFVLLEMAAIFMFHSSILEVIKIVTIANALLFASLVFYNRKDFGMI